MAMAMSTVQMVAMAKAHIENLTPDEVAAELESGTATLIDVREEGERRSKGWPRDAHHAPRGMLEFYADPTSPWHRDEFDSDARLILMCETGGRSALATEMLQKMGFRRVAHLDGGFRAWRIQGLPVLNDE